jgi:hypothetical protein
MVRLPQADARPSSLRRPDLRPSDQEAVVRQDEIGRGESSGLIACEARRGTATGSSNIGIGGGYDLYAWGFFLQFTSEATWASLGTKKCKQTAGLAFL